MQIQFSKMHGLGNDFMVIDQISQDVRLSPELIARLADRHTGVGFDQLLCVEPPTDPDSDFRYRIFNADGTEAEQCGNGARCFAKFVVDSGLSVKTELRLQTNTGTITTQLRDDGNVEVDMGVPSIVPEADSVRHRRRRCTTLPRRRRHSGSWNSSRYRWAIRTRCCSSIRSTMRRSQRSGRCCRDTNVSRAA